MRWIADSLNALSIRYVIQVGDLVNTDNCGVGSYVLVNDDPTRPRCDDSMRAAHVYYPLPDRLNHYQYVNASNGISILDRAGIPYSLAVGNHDTAAVCGGPACTRPPSKPDWGVPDDVTTNMLLRRTDTWDATFPTSRFPDANFFDPASAANMYRTFQAGGLNWLVVNLELWPRTEVVDWAAQVVASHPDHNAVVVTHQYLTSSGNLSTGNGGYGDTSSKYLFDHLISVYPNIRLVFSGHVLGPAHRLDTGQQGNKVLAVLTCFHDAVHAQTTMVTIDPSADTVAVVTTVDPGSTQIVPGSEIQVGGMQWVR